MKRILVGAHQSPTCYTLSPHTVANNSLGAAAKRVCKKVFQHQPFGERQGSLRKSARRRPSNRSHGSPPVRAALRSPVTATRSIVNSLFENLVDFFGVDGSAGVQPINGICYLGLPEKRCCLGPPLWSLASESLSASLCSSWYECNVNPRPKRLAIHVCHWNGERPPAGAPTAHASR
jgi:hypothetical protein